MYVIPPLTSTKLTNWWPQKLSAYGQSRAPYKEVQDRHEDIKKIELTLEELAQLYNGVHPPLLFPRINR